MRGLLVTVGSDRWAVDLERVHEVLAAPVITPVPGSPPTLLGICNRRGDVLPVVSLTGALGAGPPGPAERSAPFVVVVDSADGPAGFPVTVVPQLCDLGEAVALGDEPGAVAVHRVEGTKGRVDGMVGPDAVTLLDVIAVLTAARIAGNA